MLQKELGQTGLKIPEIGLGTWDFHGTPAALLAGLEAGAWFIDTAESYGTEPVVAEAIRGVRERVFLATKISPQHFRRADVFRAAEQSLARLRVDHLDLYQLHHPNPKIPLEETLGAMEELADAGKVRFIGVSNFDVARLQSARRIMRKHAIVSNQIRYNLADRTIEAELLPYCRANGVTVIAYSPLCKVRAAFWIVIRAGSCANWPGPPARRWFKWRLTGAFAANGWSPSPKAIRSNTFWRIAPLPAGG